MTEASLNHIVALVPVRSLSGAKSRLGEPLDAEDGPLICWRVGTGG